MGRAGRRSSRFIVAAGVVLSLVAAACSSDDDASSPTSDAVTTTEAADAGGVDTTEPAPTMTEDRAYYILPPGNYGGLPVNDNSLDQLPLYDGLTPLRGGITDADIDELFLAADFEPVGATTEEPTGRPGTTILYDSFGVPHITGETREDLAFGAGWVTAATARCCSNSAVARHASPWPTYQASMPSHSSRAARRSSRAQQPSSS